MAEVCPECGYPQGPYNRDPAFDCVCTGDINCDGRALARVKAQLAAAHACIEAADKVRARWPNMREDAATVYDAARAEYERVAKGHHERGV